jgi:hypothetical protein
MSSIAFSAMAWRSAPGDMAIMSKSCASSGMDKPCEQQDTNSYNGAAQQLQHPKCI